MSWKILVSLVIGIGFAGFLWHQARYAQPEQPQRATQATVLASATIFPLATLVDEIGGGHVAVNSIIPPGVSEHLFEPTPQDVAIIQQAEVVFVVGAGLDDWMLQYARPDAKIIDMSETIRLRTTSHGHDDDYDDDHDDEKTEEENYDPHYWLAPINGQVMALRIRDVLAQIDPQHEQDYTSHYYAFVAKLDDVLAEYDEVFTQLQGMKIITTHDAFEYLAEAVGVEVVATVEPVAGEEPSPQYVASLGKAIRENAISVVFSEPQLGGALTNSLVQDYGVKIMELDPLGGVPGRETYLELLKYNFDQLAQLVDTTNTTQNEVTE